jgi:hypothetical protein
VEFVFEFLAQDCCKSFFQNSFVNITWWKIAQFNRWNFFVIEKFLFKHSSAILRRVVGENYFMIFVKFKEFEVVFLLLLFLGEISEITQILWRQIFGFQSFNLFGFSAFWLFGFSAFRLFDFLTFWLQMFQAFLPKLI